MSSVATHEFNIPRQSVVGSEGLWTKMFDPPRLGPPTPEMLDLTALPQGTRANPVPDIMAAAGLLNGPGDPHTVHKSLMHGVQVDTWDKGTPGQIRGSADVLHARRE